MSTSKSELKYNRTLQVWVMTRDNTIPDCNHQACHEDRRNCNQHKYKGQTVEEVLNQLTKKI